MRRIGLAGLAVVAVVAGAGERAQAQTAWGANLSGSQQVPANGSTATGSALLSLSGSMLTVNLTWNGLVGVTPTGPAFGHIHCCTTGNAAGQNTAVAVPFLNLPGTASATYAFTYDLMSVSTYTTAFLSANGNTAAGAFQALVAGLNANEAYVNLHDGVYPAGEIRANVSAVPEPTTFALAALGLTGAGLVARRRRA